MYPVDKTGQSLIRSGVEEYCKRSGLKVDTGKFFGKIVYWFVILAFALAASDILNFSAFSNFLNSILVYIPNIVVGRFDIISGSDYRRFLKP